jgi:hypothetical protein
MLQDCVSERPCGGRIGLEHFAYEGATDPVAGTFVAQQMAVAALNEPRVDIRAIRTRLLAL